VELLFGALYAPYGWLDLKNRQGRGWQIAKADLNNDQGAR